MTDLTLNDLKELFPGSLVVVTPITPEQILEATAKAGTYTCRNKETGELFSITRFDSDWRAMWCTECGRVTAHRKHGNGWKCRHTPGGPR